MNIQEDFKIYLKKWCKTNHKPLPPEGKINKYWQMAWEDYMKTVLTENWEARKQEYYDIPLLTKQEEKRQQRQKQLESQYEEEKTDSSWDRIKKFLN